ncbi:Stk1 family PASTA domain-containing Ser/Thr kinase [Georgenia faecalis]|uniref:Stk1 family PASTA domain-containing Ser/Thr kinase n=1 Tax=Georgenia faecalis TaxID=2483799 RepID=UPI0019CFD122|nr:Stk1 family PASTA domain-containing Ser/Thr kinase [Georgenia faecalis]
MQPAVSDPMTGRLVDGRYEVVGRIARGGMATVYRAVDRRLDRTVALKVMHPHLAESADFVARFRREARAAARLSHPGIVAIYDQGFEGDSSYLTMEFVDGPNLRTVLRARGALSLGEALDLLDAVLDALAAAHRAGLVHRDVKPENVLLTSAGRPKVADFGLARAVTEATAASTGTVLGTVAYLAPEIVTSGLADARADVYACGVLLYELLTGTQPFEGEAPIQVAYQHVHTDIPAPSERVAWLPAEVDELVAALTARTLDERPADAGAALDLLRRTRDAVDDATLARVADVAPRGPAAEADDPHSTRVTPVHEVRGTVALPIGAIARPTPEPDPAGPRRRRRRRRAVALSVLALVLAVVVGGSAWWFVAGPGAYTPVPAVVGLDEDSAVTLLADADLGVDVQREHHDTAPAGEVVSADPAPGEPVRRDGTVRLLVSQGILMVEVPPLAELPLEDAVAALEEVGLTPGAVEEPWSDDVPAGVVMSSAPGAGEVVPHTQPVDLVVSAGREPVALVSVVGATAETAQADLTAAGLTPVVAEEYSATVAAGRVIRQDPSPGPDVQLYRGDEVTIVVSLGPEPVPVPDVVGQQIGAARTTLEEAGFVVEVEEILGGFFGTVRSMSPGAGEALVPGSTVTLTVV